jgi:hypothetical protein
MIKLTRRIATATAAGALLFQTALPAFSATTLIISGNGSDSDNEIEFETNTSTTVVQQNYTSVNNKINVDANTGNNEASGNTNGDVSIETGDVDVETSITNVLNTNVAEVQNCGSCSGDVGVLIQGNGSGSSNEVDLELNKYTQVFQNNIAHVYNKVDVNANTGDNEAEDNTGGDVDIETGDVDVEIHVSNSANANFAMVGGGNGNGGDITMYILDNGSDSDNEIDLEIDHAVVLSQGNWTTIRNKIDVEANTGDNEAEDNTGGDVDIDTGDIDVSVMVSNLAGFNFADLSNDCCFDNILGRISGNGSHSDNLIEAELDTSMQVFQENACGFGGNGLIISLFFGLHQPCFDNKIDVEAYTGNNEAEDNTGGSSADFEVETGDIDTEIEIVNMGGSNVLGSTSDWGFGGFNWDFNFSFNLGAMLSLLLSLGLFS